MRTNFIKFFGCMLLLTLGVAACKDPKDPVKPNPPDVNDPYAPVTEGKAFLPILTYKPDMNKVIEAEKKRGGELKEKLNPDPEEGRPYILYKFEYKEMDIKEVGYHIHPETGILQGVVMRFPKKEVTSSKCLLLCDKYGFNDNHILAQRYNGVVRERETLFLMNHSDEEDVTYFVFLQFDKQPKPFATIPELPGEGAETILENKFFSHGRIKTAEEKAGNTLKDENKVDSGPHKGKVYLALYTLKAEEKPMTHRGYFFDWGEATPEDKLGLCHEIVYCYTEPSLAYYFDDIQKGLIPTQEFYALCKKAGYEWKEEIKEGDCFINKKKKMMMVARKMQFDDLSPNPILLINLFKASDSDLESMEREKSINLFLKPVKANNKFIEKKNLTITD